MGLFKRRESEPAPALEAAAPPAPEPEVEIEVEVPSGVYRGRLVGDGLGNLLADEGTHKGAHVVYMTDAAGARYEFVEPGGATHWQTHHNRVVEVEGTTELDPHHINPVPTDAHYAEDGGRKNAAGKPSYTRITSHPDKIAPIQTGHTDAYADVAA